MLIGVAIWCGMRPAGKKNTMPHADWDDGCKNHGGRQRMTDTTGPATTGSLISTTGCSDILRAVDAALSGDLIDQAKVAVNDHGLAPVLFEGALAGRAKFVP